MKQRLTNHKLASLAALVLLVGAMLFACSTEEPEPDTTMADTAGDAQSGDDDADSGGDSGADGDVDPDADVCSGVTWESQGSSCPEHRRDCFVWFPDCGGNCYCSYGVTDELKWRCQSECEPWEDFGPSEDAAP